MDFSKLILIGCSHQNTSLQQRESLMLTKEMRECLQKECTLDKRSEIVCLVTCNRIEVYGYDVDENQVFAAWAGLVQIHPSVLQKLCYAYKGLDAITHWLKVSVGLDSAMVGEHDILGQIKKTHGLCHSEGILHKLSQWIIKSAKKIRMGSGIGQHATSFISLSQMLAKRLFTHWHQTKVLLIGSGDMIEAALNLWSSDNSNLILCNRSLVKANCLAKIYGVKAIGLSQIPEVLKEVDCVISATASPLPLIGKGMLEQALKANKNPRLLIDLAMPRDIESEVASLDGVYLYHLDDLKLLAKEGESRRKQSTELAETLVLAEVKTFEKECRLRGAGSSIQGYHQKLQQLADLECQELLAKLNKDSEEDIKAFQRKLVHHSITLMKDFIEHKMQHHEQHEELEEA